MAAGRETEAFSEVAGRVMALYGEQRYREAAEVAAAAGREFPAFGGTVAYWTACLQALQGDGDGAVAALGDGLEAGHFWLETRLRQDPDLASLQGRKDFEAVVADSNRMLAALSAASHPHLIGAAPHGPPRGMLIALHGAAWRAEEFAPHWAAALEAGFAVAIPQSSQPSGDREFGWYDETLARREVDDARAAVSAAYDLADAPVVLGGFSQGGRLALEWALAGAPLASRGFVVVGPAVRNGRPSPPATVGAAVERGVKGFILVGELDSFRGSIERRHAELTAQGLPCELEIIRGVGHGFPKDFDRRLAGALEFVLGT